MNKKPLGKVHKIEKKYELITLDIFRKAIVTFSRPRNHTAEVFNILENRNISSINNSV